MSCESESRDLGSCKLDLGVGSINRIILIVRKLFEQFSFVQTIRTIENTEVLAYFDAFWQIFVWIFQENALNLLYFLL